MLWDPLVAAEWVALQWGLLSYDRPWQNKEPEALFRNPRIEDGAGKCTELAWDGGCDLGEDPAPVAHAFGSISQGLNSGNSNALRTWWKKKKSMKIETLGWTSVWCYVDKSLNWDIEFNQFYWLAFKHIHSNSFGHRYSESQSAWILEDILAGN